MWQGGVAKDRPADLGYFVGFRICQSYYENATDKNMAVIEIIRITNCKDFLEKSNYERRFRK